MERLDIDEEQRGNGIGTAAIASLSSEYGSIVAAPDNENCKRLFERIGTDVSNEYWMVDQGFGVYEV
ncbi:hypothetical protein JC200_23945 (plasmid) [Alicyclobacillus sp. ALC3]|nr:hypothetical protein [Alicyclobacillus sp. ALC3]WDL99694.1 hypothetical protein JC200_23945 [Alicyclobacillus sp. ALC3]